MRLSLNGLNHTYTSDIVMLLVGPMGQQYVFFGGVGNDTASTNIDLKLYDGAADLMGSGPLASGSYKPTNLGVATFPFPPAPQGPYFNAAPSGSDTFTSTFGGTDPNGVWSLYVFDQFNPDSGSIAGGWDLDIQTIPPGPGTVEFSAAAFNSIEGALTPITVKRAGGSAGAISVDYATGAVRPRAERPAARESITFPHPERFPGQAVIRRTNRSTCSSAPTRRAANPRKRST